MARGRRKLFDDLVSEPKQTLETNWILRRGRNSVFIANRNKCLFYRYYYYAKIIRLRYEEVLEALSNDFFISPRTISNILVDYSESLKMVFKEKPTIKELDKNFNFLNWRVQQTNKKV